MLQSKKIAKTRFSYGTPIENPGWQVAFAHIPVKNQNACGDVLLRRKTASFLDVDCNNRMPQLPSLTDFQLRHCKVCVRLDHAVEFEKSLILRHKTRDEDELVRVSCHGGAGKNPSFLHVEMAVRDWFPVEKPKVAGRKQKFDKLIEALKGQECDANVAGTFRVKFEHLPESGIIRAAATPSAPHQGLTIRLRGATFDLKGMPFSSLQWSLVQPAAGLKEQMVNVTISGRTKVVVSDFYLQESVKFLTTWFNSIVMGK